MQNSIISEGKTTEQAIENGLQILKVSRKQVDIKVLEEENKKSFFSILTPRVVKVELTVKENVKDSDRKAPEKKHEKPVASSVADAPKRNTEKKYNQNIEEVTEAKNKIEQFMKEFVSKFDSEEVQAEVNLVDYEVRVNITGTNTGFLIGYRGDVLESLQVLLSSIANSKRTEKIRVLVDVSGYREKRVKTLEDLAEKISKTVIRTGKSITLEPMSSYERKIIHSKIQNNPKIATHSIGEEPYRKIVIALNK